MGGASGVEEVVVRGSDSPTCVPCEQLVRRGGVVCDIVDVVVKVAGGVFEGCGKKEPIKMGEV